MKRIILAGLALAVLASPALAQSTTVTTGTSGATTITIAPEQRTKIREYVVEKRVRPVTVKERIVVGETLPDDIELHAVPGDWGPSLTRYRYVYVDNDVVLVDPSTRRIVQVIE